MVQMYRSPVSEKVSESSPPFSQCKSFVILMITTRHFEDSLCYFKEVATGIGGVSEVCVLYKRGEPSKKINAE